MPLEAINCTNCGSADVKEVKPNTYFCNHCESVFKHVDPTQITVDHTPSFCLCGNPIQVQCEVCRNGMCRTCDVIRARDGSGGYTPDATEAGSNIVMPVVGFGYALQGVAMLASAGPKGVWGSRHRFRIGPIESYYWSVAGGRIVPLPIPTSSSDVVGPVMPVDELLATLGGGRGRLRHVCWRCLTTAVPDTADRIADANLCEDCRAPSVGRCECCGGAFCKGCFSFSAASEGPIVVVEARWRYPWALQHYDVPWPEGLFCYLCRGEHKAALRKVCATEYAHVLEESSRSDDSFYVPCHTARRRTQGAQRRAQRVEEEKAKAVAERCARELTARSKLLVNEGCKLQWLNQGAGRYSVIDERDRTAPAAAPEVMGTR